MKNFKRVISAVIALALSASTLVAVSASKFADVDGTNYAEAIDVLTALDVIHGYEEEEGLVFKPDGEITRAEAATMIVGALNMNADAKAAAGVSKFTDVNEKASWATGYVNVGVAQGFINGMDDTTFAPQENVTYAQMCVMLTLITGYGDYAKTYGGWPTGYTTMAASAGINKGVAVSNDTPLKRGQVAQMLYNAVTTPVLGISEYRLDGNSYKKLDGTGSNEYKSILSDKFEGFEVKATVDSFPAAGEVKLTNVTSDYKAATDADRFFSTVPTSTTPGIINKAIIENGIDLSSAIQQQVRAILYVDNNDKVHLVFAAQTDAVETKEVVADDLENVDYAANQKIKFGSTKYNFANSLNIYVNGELYTATALTPATAGVDTTIQTILDAATGNVKFAKVAPGATNYDTIFVDAYIMGQVTNVSYKNEVTTVKFSPASNNLGSYKKIEIADNDIATDSVKVAVTLDGQAIELKDLQENDIIAVKTKIGTTTDITANNENITVLVSRETISGQVTSIEDGTGENAYVIEGTEYSAVDKANVGLAVGEKYNKIYLDSFGRVYGYDDEAVEDTTKYAILAKVTDKTDLILVLPDGTRKSYEAKNDTIYAAGTKALEISGTAPTGVTTGTVLNAVVEYTVKSGQINSMAPVAGVAFSGKYKESVGKVQTVGIGDGTGVVIADTSSYKDYKAMKASDFVDEEDYTGAGFGKIGSTSNYSLVIVTVAGYDFGANSRFAVVNAGSFSTGIDADGDSVDQLKVLVNGEKTTLDFAPGAKLAFGAVNYGDAFFYTVDTDGLVDGTVKITRGTIAAAGDLAIPFASGKYDTAKWDNTLTGNKDIKLVRGLVVKTGTNSVSLLKTPAAVDAPVDFDAFETFSLADDCVIYTYDTDSEVADKNKLDEEGVLVAMSYKDWTITEAPVATPAEAFTDSASGPLNNGVYDLGETFVDANGNGVWDDAVVIPAGYSTASIGQIAWGFTPTKAEALKAHGIKTSKFDTLDGETAAGDAQYALALIVDDKVVEIYEILAD